MHVFVCFLFSLFFRKDKFVERHPEPAGDSGRALHLCGVLLVGTVGASFPLWVSHFMVPISKRVLFAKGPDHVFICI